MWDLDRRLKLYQSPVIIYQQWGETYFYVNVNTVNTASMSIRLALFYTI